MKKGHYQVGEALSAAGHTVIYREEEILAAWKKLGHAFLTWQILNGLLRRCRFIGLAGAANLFSCVPIECLYLYEFSDKMVPNSITLKGRWQQTIFGSSPIFDTPDRLGVVQKAKKKGVLPYSGIHMGYEPMDRIPAIVEKAATTPRRPDVVLPRSLEPYGSE
jgi:hypothetical protein